VFKRSLLLAAGLIALATAAPVQSYAQTAAPLVVDQARVEAHEAFLAGDALRGRGSATPDEAVAAAYIAARFQEYGLKPAPGMTGYLQTAGVVRREPVAPSRRARWEVIAPEGAERITTNAIGYLQETIPSAGVL
jgi:aminopeptidase YwaD